MQNEVVSKLGFGTLRKSRVVRRVVSAMAVSTVRGHPPAARYFQVNRKIAELNTYFAAGFWTAGSNLSGEVFFPLSPSRESRGIAISAMA